MSKTVYLAGPISGHHYVDATDWRDRVMRALAAHGIVAYSPLRGKEYLRKEAQLSGHPSAYAGIALSNPQGIVTRDRFDCQRCDVVLMNLLPAEETGLVSVGSMIEVGWADSVRAPIVTVMTEKNPHYHAMVTALSGYVVETLADAVRIVVALLNQEPRANLYALEEVDQ